MSILRVSEFSSLTTTHPATVERYDLDLLLVSRGRMELHIHAIESSNKDLFATIQPVAHDLRPNLYEFSHLAFGCLP